MVARHLDLDRLLAVVPDRSVLYVSDPSRAFYLMPQTVRDAHPVIAVARDAAFHFTYEDNLDLLRATGAEITFFSPLQDTALPAGTTGIMLSGGFPEVYAAQLSANTAMRHALCQAHAQGLPIYAECGGLMYLTESIVDLHTQEYPMVGLLPGRSVMSGRLTLGYRLAQAVDDSWLFRSGETVRGHEFHYSVWEDRPADLSPAYALLPPTGSGDPRPEGACLGSLWASYVHLHFWAKPELAVRFVETCCRHLPPHGFSEDT
jgi:cobyrinic acid a,c-diamide synthase